MTEQDAASLAVDAARGAGWNLDGYSVTQVTLDGDLWRFLYQAAAPTPPGGHFSVQVDGRTGATLIVPGR